jgi:hypothetical protein
VVIFRWCPCGWLVLIVAASAAVLCHHHRNVDQPHKSQLATRSSPQAKGTVGGGRSSFSLAVTTKGWRSDNPAKGIERNHESKRERYLSGDELTRLTEALAAYPDQEAANAIRLLLLTGARCGVPMGGDLRHAPDGKSPTFLVAAMKDPLSGNLDRIQIVKGWVDAAGNIQEKVYDVVWSGDRKPGADGKLPSVGNTVDVAEATWTNTIGSPEITAWKDPDFDPSLRAFYYGRVIEIPTLRWTAYDQKRFAIKMAPSVPMIVAERAYTSPIWYTP